VPLAPDHLARRLRDALPPGSGAAVARTPDGLQSLCLVVRTELHQPLAAILARGEHPPVHDWLAEVRACEVRFDDGRPFLNVNRAEDFDAAARALAARA
jgi:molybdopterin-guanine dinucleotide biosynthesis protein A